jgi:hypothetical protein
MKRWLFAVLLGLVLTASSAQAHGVGSGYVQPYAATTIRWGQNGQGVPGVLGPWYLYWPLEAHFVTPAHPLYSAWPGCQTLPGGAGAVAHPSPGVPSYWH